jgi:hypothetical protein
MKAKPRNFPPVQIIIYFSVNLKTKFTNLNFHKLTKKWDLSTQHQNKSVFQQAKNFCAFFIHHTYKHFLWKLYSC